MLIIAIIVAIFLVYMLNFRNTSTDPPPNSFADKRVGGVFSYNDMFDLTQDELPVNTIAGPGGGTFVKKYV